ncbi:MAG TPA: AAA family ATPase [Steroidobacteraceae bacterium]|nr:AAA family ATPase [Steroidobacteraceae bacterium]
MSHAADARRALDPVVAAISGIVLGKDRQIRLALACLLARGHLLIEDLPGVGKTTLAQSLARVLGLSYQRVQFTSDLLPADVIGVSVYDRDRGHFEFHRGPVFAQLLLADEINRATPKAQSALLEAMEERQVTIDGHTHLLPDPFFVVATQNPSYQLGTYPLPESQLDRFLMRIGLGYPSAGLERELLRGRDRRAMLAELKPILPVAVLGELQRYVPDVHVAEPLLDYVQALVQHTRESGHFEAGLSPRAAIALLRAAQAWALLHGRTGVLPEDVQAVARAVAGHRLQLRAAVDGGTDADLDQLLLRAVAVP